MAHFPENYRGIHAISLLKEAQALTLDGLIDLAYDPYLPGAEALIVGLLEAAQNVSPETENCKKAIDILKGWDFKVSKETPAMTLAQYYLQAYRSSGKADYGRKQFIEMVEYMSKESSEAERMEQFEAAVAQLVNDFGSAEVPWGEYNRYQRLNGDIVQKFNDSLQSIPVGMAAGYWGALASFGTRHGEDTKRVYGVGGNSFVAVVEFGDTVKAKTLLAGGQSGDPKSPHFDDQARRYADRQFKEAAYYRADVEKRAVSRYSPGQ